MPHRYNISVEWQLNRACNFHCPYCFPGLSKPANDFFYRGNLNIDTVVKSFDQSGLIWHIVMVGGEPFLYPSFIELCQRLTQKHYLTIGTNLSTKNVFDFCNKIDPEKIICMHCSLHYTERERLHLKEDFIEKVNLLRKNGFETYVSQLIWPPLINDAVRIFDEFMEHDIAVRPKVFRGFYHGNEYPKAYSKKERELFILLTQRANENDRWKHKEKFLYEEADRYILYGNISFKGATCLAGKDWFVIQFNGDAVRCNDDPIHLGNFFKGGIRLLSSFEPCHARFCRCARAGLLHAQGKPRRGRLSFIDYFKIKYRPIMICVRNNIFSILNRK